MHPVICGELRSVRRQHRVARAVILPENRLHIGAQVAVIRLQVNAQEVAVRPGKRSTRLLVFRSYSQSGNIGHFQCRVFHARSSSRLTLTEGEGARFVIFRSNFQAVRVRVHVGNNAVAAQLLFGVAARQRATVFHHGVLRLERIHISALYRNRNVLEARNFIVIHNIGRFTCGNVALAERDSRTIFQNGFRTAVPRAYLVSCATRTINDGCVLVTATVKPMIRCGAGNNIERARVSLVMRVHLSTSSNGARCLHIFCRVVFAIRQRGVQVHVFVGNFRRCLRQCVGNRFHKRSAGIGGSRNRLNAFNGLRLHNLRRNARCLARSQLGVFEICLVVGTIGGSVLVGIIRKHHCADLSVLVDGNVYGNLVRGPIVGAFIGDGCASCIYTRRVSFPRFKSRKGGRRKRKLGIISFRERHVLYFRGIGRIDVGSTGIGRFFFLCLRP